MDELENVFVDVPRMKMDEAFKAGERGEKIKRGFVNNIPRPDEERARKKSQMTGDPDPEPRGIELRAKLSTQVRTYFHYLQRDPEKLRES